MTGTVGVLARLELSGLIRLARTDPQVEYLFRHALVHDAAYGSISRQDRRDLHRLAGDILEQLATGASDEIASTLAFHFERAGLPQRAVGYQLRAADRAARDHANGEAIDLYRAALDGPATTTVPVQHLAMAYERFGTVLELVGNLDAAITAYAKALDHTAEGDRESQARLHRRMGNAHRVARRVPETRASFQTATALLDAVPSADRAGRWWGERIDLLLDRALLHYFWGSVDELREVLDECAPALDRFATDAQQARYHARRALHMARSNHMVVTAEILAAQRRARDLWRAVGDPTDTELAIFQLGLFHVMRGELDEARRHLNDSLAAAELTGDVVLQSRCFTYLALAARFAGDPDEMERIHERAMPAITAGGMTEYEAMIEANRCWAARRRGDTEAARRHAAAALEIGGRSPVATVVKPSAHLPLMAMALDSGDLAEAAEHAAAIANDCWVDEEYGRAIHEAVEAHARGDSDDARQALRHALGLAARIGWV